MLGRGHTMHQKHRLLRKSHTWVSVLLTQPLLLPQTLSHSLKMADQNLEKLKLESERLEQHAQKSVNWLLWAMLIVVCFVFISMILFIRIMPRLK
jgi:hypothetical protein